METIQFIQTSPDQLKNEITEAISKQLEQLKAEFQPKEPTAYLTRHQVADLLHIDLSTLHYWTKAGKLTSYGIGNRVYYKRDEVEAAIIKLNR